ncbi:DNA polymerase III subunit delta [Pseudoluteimonas lycopersici]|uniref:DNA polymerase III subunit delta n=1 Tax=Pseudoluteimonas lycopersici TaxID=1324796 RepID=A0A516V494_9GAMM|nr:DNA polymerase III subunit delta [Lysobacter lycopersici]QDQ73307.1 DNA polymerase III subunit delta [Lysobacter lycopersici]
MPTLAPDALPARLAGEPLRPAYLIAGAESLLVLEAADAVRAAAREQGCSERETFEADARGFDWNALASQINAPSLFSAKRLLELQLPTGKPGKEGAELIAGFCANPPPDVTLLVLAGAWSRQHGGKWSEAVSRTGHFVEVREVRAHELPNWLERRLRARGLRADAGAVQLLAERVQGNLLAAAQEVDKLALLDDGRPLDAARMEQLIAESARYDVFGLVDAALNGKPAQVARMLAGLQAEGEAVPALMGMVTMELQRAAALAQTKARGGNLAAEFRAQRVWDSKQAAYTRALSRHDAAQWERFVAEAGRVDRIAKGRAPGDAWRQLERLLLAVADAKARRMLAA